MTVRESGVGLLQFCVGLHLMAHVQYGFVAQMQFGGQCLGRFTFADPSHQQYNLHGRPLTALKDRTSVQVVNPITLLTTIDFQLASSRAPELSRMIYSLLAFGTLKTLWMKVPEDPFSAAFVLKKFCDWKFHA